MKIELKKKQILQGSYLYPKDFIKLKPTNHCLERLKERGQGLDFLPSFVKITNNNIHSGRTIDGKRLKSIVIKIKYKCDKDLFLCFNPFDGALKTIWYENRKRPASRKNSKSTIQNNRS